MTARLLPGVCVFLAVVIALALVYILAAVT